MDKLVIFDFDGTIADTINTKIDLIIKTATEMDLPEDLMSVMTSDALGDYSLSDLISMSGIPKEEVFRLMGTVEAEMNEKLNTFNLIRGIKREIIALGEIYPLGILTANTKEVVEKIIISNGLKVFQFIVSEQNPFAKDNALQNIIKNEGVDATNTVYIGDEVHDVYATQKLGVKSLAVTWGFNSRIAFKSSSPDLIIDNVNDLSPAVKRLI